MTSGETRKHFSIAYLKALRAQAPRRNHDPRAGSRSPTGAAQRDYHPVAIALPADTEVQTGRSDRLPLMRAVYHHFASAKVTNRSDGRSRLALPNSTNDAQPTPKGVWPMRRYPPVSYPSLSLGSLRTVWFLSALQLAAPLPQQTARIYHPLGRRMSPTLLHCGHLYVTAARGCDDRRSVRCRPGCRSQVRGCGGGLCTPGC